MEIEPLAGSRKELVTLENRDEIRVILDAMAPRSLSSFYKPFLKLIEGLALDAEFPKSVALSKRQLRWIGKRLAPWENHPLLHLPERDVDTAHGIVVSINDYLTEAD
jgi:hypothetical protein